MGQSRPIGGLECHESPRVVLEFDREPPAAMHDDIQIGELEVEVRERLVRSEIVNRAGDLRLEPAVEQLACPRRRPVLRVQHPGAELRLEDLLPELAEQCNGIRVLSRFRREVDRASIVGELFGQLGAVVEAVRPLDVWLLAGDRDADAMQERHASSYPVTGRSTNGQSPLDCLDRGVFAGVARHEMESQLLTAGQRVASDRRVISMRGWLFLSIVVLGAATAAAAPAHDVAFWRAVVQAKYVPPAG